MFEKIQLVPIQSVVALPCAFWAFAGEFAQYLCPGDSLSGIAVLLMLLNRALTRCVNSDFLIQIRSRQTKHMSGKSSKINAGYRFEGFISDQMLVGGCTKQVE
jgi:hypothetical protein